MAKQIGTHYGSTIYDVTDTANRPGCLRAERVGLMALILHKLDTPVKRFDGKRVMYRIEEAVLSQEENELACVRYNQFEFYSKKELAAFFKEGKPLFETVNFN